MAVPFQWRLHQGQGRQALRTPNGQSSQVSESVWLMSNEVCSHNRVKSVHDRVFYNSATRVPVTSASVCPAVCSSDHLLCDVMQVPSELASAELGELPEGQDQRKQWNQPSGRMWLSLEACPFILGHAEHGRNGAVRALENVEMTQFIIVSHYCDL